MMKIEAVWKLWEDEKPRFEEDIFVIGDNFKELDSRYIVQYSGEPEYILLEEGGYQYTGNLINLKLYLSSDCSLVFYPEQYGFEIKYWIYLNDLLPNFCK